MKALEPLLEIRGEGSGDLERRAVHLVQAGAPDAAIPLLLEAVQLRSRISLPAALELVGRAGVGVTFAAGVGVTLAGVVAGAA